MHTEAKAGDTVAITLTPSAQFLRDVLCTAVEGGSNYWAHFKAIDTFKGEHGSEWEKVTVYEVGDGDDKTVKHIVGPVELLEGIRRILAGDMTDKADHANVHVSNRAALFQALVSEDGGDAGQVDADLADLVLQAAALGRIVYG